MNKTKFSYKENRKVDKENGINPIEKRKSWWDEHIPTLLTKVFLPWDWQNNSCLWIDNSMYLLRWKNHSFLWIDKHTYFVDKSILSFRLIENMGWCWMDRDRCRCQWGYGWRNDFDWTNSHPLSNANTIDWEQTWLSKSIFYLFLPWNLII